MELCSIVVARNLGLGKKERVQIRPSLEVFLKQTIDMYGLDLSNTINAAVENYLREKQYLTLETLEILNICSDLEKQIFKNGIDETAEHINEQTVSIIFSKIKERIPQS